MHCILHESNSLTIKMDEFGGLWFNCENMHTVTSEEQCGCEKLCAEYLRPLCTYTSKTRRKLKEQGLSNEKEEVCLLRSLHIAYLMSGLENLPESFISLDCSRPWICYWICQALYLLHSEPIHLYPRVISTLSSMQSISGGFGGGPGQLPHAAPNYAAVLTLCIIGTPEAFDSIDRPAMYRYFLSLKSANGGFQMHKDGEVDSRGTYTVIAIARLLNILTPELSEGVVAFLLQCQSYEGGFAGEPFNEAHGGYNFCALAALVILGAAGQCDLRAQEHWLISRQMKLEGGFQGRTNKLVDSCYSFWQGAALAILEIVKQGGDDLYDVDLYLQEEMDERAVKAADEEEISEGARIQVVTETSGCLPFNQKALQRYILHCAQNSERGGMQDKPGKARDFYHSCYSLSGLSIAQSCRTCPPVPVGLNESLRNESVSDDFSTDYKLDFRWAGAQVYGDVDNLLEPTSAVYNIGLKKVKNAISYFQNYPSSHSELLARFSTSNSDDNLD